MELGGNLILMGHRGLAILTTVFAIVVFGYAILGLIAHTTMRLERLRSSLYAAYRRLEITALTLSRAFAVAALVLAFADKIETMVCALVASVGCLCATRVLAPYFKVEKFRFFIRAIVFQEGGEWKIVSFEDSGERPIRGERLFSFAQTCAETWAEKNKISGRVQVLDVKVLPPLQRR